MRAQGTYHRSHFPLWWRAVDAVATPAGRPEAEEQRCVVHCPDHCFIPESSVGNPRKETTTAVRSFTALSYFLLLKVCRMLNSVQSHLTVKHLTFKLDA